MYASGVIERGLSEREGCVMCASGVSVSEFEY